MAYGIRIKNSSGEIQIDGDYRNLEYKQGGTGATISHGGTGYTYATTIGLTAGPLVPLVLIRPGTSRFVTLLSYDKSGSDYNGFKMTTESGQSDTIDWKCFRETTTNSTGYGMRIFNSSGDAVFHSASEYLKILQVNSISLGNPSFSSWPYTDITHSSYSNPYYILTPIGKWITDYVGPTPPIPPGMYHFYGMVIGIKKLSSTSVRVGWFNLANYNIPGAPSGTNTGWNPTVQLIVCQ